MLCSAALSLPGPWLAAALNNLRLPIASQRCPAVGRNAHLGVKTVLRAIHERLEVDLADGREIAQALDLRCFQASAAGDLPG